MSNTAWHLTNRAVFRRIRGNALERFRRRMIVLGITVPLVGLVVALGVQTAFADTPPASPVPSADASAPAPIGGTIVLGVAIVMAAALLAAGYAVGHVGSAAMGAASERPELMVRGLVFVALAEGIAVWGLIVAVLLLGKM
ncbi:MAG: ATP synthase subunit C [Planctomycetota bacterium]